VRLSPRSAVRGVRGAARAARRSGVRHRGACAARRSAVSGAAWTARRTA